MKNGTPLNKHFTPYKLFLFGLILLVTLTVVRIPFTGGTAFFALLHSDFDDSFMDFFNSIYDAGFENPYAERGVIYPPLTYLFYRLCGLALPAAERHNSFPYSWQIATDWKQHQYGQMLILAVTGLSIFFLFKALIPREKRSDPGAHRVVAWILLGTVPFWYAIERGNLVLLTLAFLAYFVNNYDSQSPLRRELALICLAISVSFKIYPVCFGILLLLDKRYFATLRCVLYGAILFFVPFLFFGGFGSLGTMLKNIQNTGDLMATFGWGYKLNIDNTLSFLAECFRVPVVGASTIKLVFVAIILLTIFLAKEKWQRLMALSAVMIIFPGFSYTYTLVFAVIPLLCFMQSKPQTTTRNLLFSVLFLCMFAPFPVGAYSFFEAEPERIYQLNLTTIVSSLAVLAMVVLVAVDAIACRIIRHSSKTHKCGLRLFGMDISWAVVRFCLIALALAIAFAALLLYWKQSYGI